ncbi:MAG TPA: hypothetical protein VGC97_21210, partial [Pyrinomonadaceae bacterium]
VLRTSDNNLGVVPRDGSATSRLPVMTRTNPARRKERSTNSVKLERIFGVEVEIRFNRKDWCFVLFLM